MLHIPLPQEAKTYPQLPDEVKYICCGLKESLIVKKFRTVSQLREHIEKMEWHERIR